jgi:aryl-alcohol dehydrogenase-like predicted oxidoreductase
MRRRRLGSDGPLVGAIGLGCMPMSQHYGPPDEAGGIAAIRRGLELGCSLVDTADAYGPFTNEALVGKAIRGHRESFVLATKCGLIPGAAAGQRGVDGRPAHVRAACEASLRRLGVETIDLYYLHRLDPAVPVEETVGAFADLVRAGKVRHIGLCEVGPDVIRRAHAVHPLTAVQSEYSLWARDVEAEVLPTLEELGIALVAYSPLGRGFFAGALRTDADLAPDDWRRSVPRFQGENLERNQEHLARLEALAAARGGCSSGQLALAWLLAGSPLVVPIPGTRRVRHLEENCAAAGLELSPDELELVSSAIDLDRGSGRHLSPRDPNFQPGARLTPPG